MENKLPTVSNTLEGELAFCNCGAVGEEGHTFECVMEQMRKSKFKNKNFPTPESWEKIQWDEEAEVVQLPPLPIG